MNYEELTLKSRSSLRRFSHRSRFAIAIEMLDPHPGDRILDYGTGDAELLVQLRARDPGLAVAAFEPNEWCRTQALDKTSRLEPRPLVAANYAALADFRPTKVACLEVLEHLPAELIEQALQNLSALAKAGATLLVSVPIEVGPPAILKYLVRFRTERPRPSLRELWAMLIGSTERIVRLAPRDGYIYSHVGFNFRSLPALFRRHGLVIRERRFSPLPWLGSPFSSQVFYLLVAEPR